MPVKTIKIRKATTKDKPKIWEITYKVLQTADTYPFLPNSTKEQMLNYWFGKKKHTFVAEVNDEVAGVYNIKANQVGLGDHIANGSYMVHPEHQGQGIGKKMAEHSIKTAKKLGFQAMQFNYVVKSNKHAVKLWQKLGFKIIGEIPEAFRHPKLGIVNAYVMYRKL